MKVWRFTSNEAYEQLESIRDMSIDELHTFDGRSKIEDWTPLAVKPMDRKLPFGDVTSLWHMEVVSPKVIEVVKDLTEGQAEYLPLLCVNHEYYLVNVVNLVGAIDYSKAKVEYFPNSNRVMMIEKFAFLEEKLKGNHIFKLVECRRVTIYVSDEFRQRVIDSGITGARFDLIWDSEA